jgi:D-alanyl-D-alanine carboxypeptidase (penicillin-binding protein 5/6)
VIAKIASTKTLSLPGPGQMVNTNHLLGSSGITGLKTGNLGPGTYSLLFTATLDVGIGEPLQVTGVRLGGATREGVDRDVRLMIDSIAYGFQDVPLAKAGQKVGAIATPWGSTATMVIDSRASLHTWSDTPITMTMDLETPRTYRDGEVVGTVTWTAGPNATTADVRIDGTIEPPDQWWRITNPGELGG